MKVREVDVLPRSMQGPGTKIAEVVETWTDVSGSFFNVRVRTGQLLRFPVEMIGLVTEDRPERYRAPLEPERPR